MPAQPVRAVRRPADDARGPVGPLEYIVNLEFELRARKVRDEAEIVWITNESAAGNYLAGGPSVLARPDIPPAYLVLYMSADGPARACRWGVLAEARPVYAA